MNSEAGKRIFDVHCHLALSDDECDLFEIPARDEFDRWIEKQELAGQDAVRTAVAPPTCYAWPGGCADTSRLNDLVHAFQAANPASCPVSFGVVEPHHGEAALYEIDRLAIDLGMKGVMWQHRMHGVYADMPAMFDMVARAAGNGLVPLFHVTALSGNEALWRVWRLAEAFPDVPMIGLGAVSNFEQRELIAASAERAPNLLYELSGMQESRDIENLVRHLGPSRLIYGSGAHDRRNAVPFSTHFEIVSMANISPSARDEILWGNAMRVLKIDLPEMA